MSYPATFAGPQPSQDWTDNNPYLDQFQIGIESDTGAWKVGPGHWNDLGYAPGTGSRLVTDDDATAALTDNGGIIYMNSASAHSVTFPAACKVANFNVLIRQLGAGTVSLINTENVDGLSDLKGQRAIATVIYSLDVDEFQADGGLA